MHKTDKIYVAGHNGLVGGAVKRKLEESGYTNLLVRSRDELNLENQAAVSAFFKTEKPDAVILAAARVGGIKANIMYPAEFLYQNLQIQNNVIWSALHNSVAKLLFLGSSCIYPRDCQQPMKEEYFMTGRPEPTNEAYAIAKIAGMQLCRYIYEEHDRSFISCMPTNIYGPGDNFELESSHVIPALIRRMDEAKKNNLKEVIIWGSGVSRREFLHREDLATAIVYILEHYDNKEFLNVGTGEDISIKELAYMVREIVGYKGKLVFDSSKPDGMPKKLLDVTKLHEAGWMHTIDFKEGLKDTYNWYREHIAK